MIIDLSHTLNNSMPVFPGTPQPEFKVVEELIEDEIYVKEFSINGHIGTHIDLPHHMVKDGNTTSSKDISSFYGTAQVLDCRSYSENEIIGTEILSQVAGKDYPDFLLFYTGWDNHWGSEKYFGAYPVPSKELIKKLSETNIKGVGLDFISIDPVKSEELTNHRIFLNSEKVIIENLTNLEDLISKKFTFSCFPLKIEDGDGSPIRAVAILK